MRAGADAVAAAGSPGAAGRPELKRSERRSGEQRHSGARDGGGGGGQGAGRGVRPRRFEPAREALGQAPPPSAAAAAAAAAVAPAGDTGENAGDDAGAAALLDLEARAASACGSLCFVELLFWKAPEASAAIARSYDWRRAYGPDATTRGGGEEAEAERLAALEAAGDAGLPDEADLPGGPGSDLDARQAGLLAALAEAAREGRDFDSSYAPARDAVFLETAAEQLGVGPGAVRRQLRLRGLGGASKRRKKAGAKNDDDGAPLDPEARALREAASVPLTRREEAVLEDAHFLHAAKGAFFELVADTVTGALAGEDGETGENENGDNGNAPLLLDPAAADRRRRALLARWRDPTFLARSLRSLGLVKGRPSRRHEEELRDLYSKYNGSTASAAAAAKVDGDGGGGGGGASGGLESMTAQLPGGWRPAQVRRILGNIGLKVAAQQRRKKAAAASAPRRKKRSSSPGGGGGGKRRRKENSVSDSDSGSGGSASSSDVSADSSSSDDDDDDDVAEGGAAAPSSRPPSAAAAPSTEKRRRTEPGAGEDEEEGAAARAAAVRSALDALRAKRAAAAAAAVAAMREGSESDDDDDIDGENEAPAPVAAAAAAAAEKPAAAEADGGAAVAAPPLAPTQAAAAPASKRRRLKKISTMAAAAPVAGDSDDKDSLDA